MDPAGESPKPENVSQQEILVSKATSNALGKGLNQLLNEPLGQIRPYIESLKNNPQVNQDYTQAMEISINRILNLVDNLENAKETKIIPVSGGWDFKFSEEKNTEQQPIQPEIAIDESTTPRLSQLARAMNHNFNNAFAPLMGYFQIVGLSTQDETLKAHTEEALSRTQDIHGILNSIQSADYQLKISTGPDGKVNITPVPRPSVK